MSERLNEQKYPILLVSVIFLLSILCMAIFLCSFKLAHGQSLASTLDIDALRDKVERNSTQIESLNKEIDKYQSQIEDVSKQKNTLQNAVKTLDLSQQKLGTQIKATKNKIDIANLTISQLQDEINKKQSNIDINEKAVGETLNNLNQLEHESPLETLLIHKNLSEVWNQITSLEEVRTSIKENIDKLIELKKEMEDKVGKSEETKKVLGAFKSNLNDQHELISNNKVQKNKLLSETANKEANYQALLAEKQAQKKQFEDELFEIESQLKIAIDPSKIPQAKQSILSWPLDTVRITQKFGKTSSSGRLYASGTHNGVDFAAAVGTPVHAVLNGTVTGIGNTDEQPGCYSYGQWVLIQHPNGLSTISAHLSLIKVKAGQKVTTGQIIGYSGATGYVTGPHLHLGLYATQGVSIQQYTFSINCKKVSIPIADTKAYLDPLAYLPIL